MCKSKLVQSYTIRNLSLKWRDGERLATDEATKQLEEPSRLQSRHLVTSTSDCHKCQACVYNYSAAHLHYVTQKNLITHQECYVFYFSVSLHQTANSESDSLFMLDYIVNLDYIMGSIRVDDDDELIGNKLFIYSSCL